VPQIVSSVRVQNVYHVLKVGNTQVKIVKVVLVLSVVNMESVIQILVYVIVNPLVNLNGRVIIVKRKYALRENTGTLMFRNVLPKIVLLPQKNVVEYVLEVIILQMVDGGNQVLGLVFLVYKCFAKLTNYVRMQRETKYVWNKDKFVFLNHQMELFVLRHLLVPKISLRLAVLRQPMFVIQMANVVHVLQERLNVVHMGVVEMI
jgi:hypothetical protein